MPLPLLVAGAFGVLLAAAGSMAAATMRYHKQAKKQLKSTPMKIPRPPPGMTRNELKRVAQEKLQMDVTKYYNFGFCGASGAGKTRVYYQSLLLAKEYPSLVRPARGRSAGRRAHA